MKPQAQLAPNAQAERSLEVQLVELPSDISQSTLQSPAVAALCRLEGGGYMAEVNDTLREVITACYNLNKKGEITLKIQFKPGGKNTMDIVPSVSAKIPKEERCSSRMFVSETGQLTPYDPDQQRLPLKVMTFKDTPSKVIDVDDQSARKVI